MDIHFSKATLCTKTLFKRLVSRTSSIGIQNQENFTTIDNVPEIFVNAIISVEDKRFYKHKGIDFLSVARAIVTDLRTHDFTEGGSTITQQIAKNEYFTQNKNFYRKVAEVFVASDIEKEFSKDEILEIYYNTNFYGAGYYGIYNASQRLLRKRSNRTI